MEFNIDDLIHKLYGADVELGRDEPEFVNFALLDYSKSEKATSMIIVVNESFMDESVSNDISIVYLEKKLDNFCFVEFKEISDACIRFAKFRLSSEQLDSLAFALGVDESSKFAKLKNPVYFSWLDVFRDDECLHLLNEPLRFSQFPIKQVDADSFEHLGDDEYVLMRTLESKIEKNPGNEELKGQIKLAQQKFETAHWNFFTDLFEENLHFEEFIPVKELNLDSLYPVDIAKQKSLQYFFNLSADNILKEVKKKSTLNYFIGSYSDFWDLRRSAEKKIFNLYRGFNFCEDDFENTREMVEDMVDLAMQDGWNSGSKLWHVSVPLALVSYLSISSFYQGIDDFKFIFLPVFAYVLDLEFRLVSKLQSGEKFNPGILGIAKTCISYCFDFFELFKAKGSYLTSFKSED